MHDNEGLSIDGTYDCTLTFKKKLSGKMPAKAENKTW